MTIIPTKHIPGTTYGYRWQCLCGASCSSSSHSVDVHCRCGRIWRKSDSVVTQQGGTPKAAASPQLGEFPSELFPLDVLLPKLAHLEARLRASAHLDDALLCVSISGWLSWLAKQQTSRAEAGKK